MCWSAPEGSARGRALAVLLVVGIVLGAAAWARWPRLIVSAGLTAADDRLVTLDREIAEEFGLSRPVVFVIVARDGNVWTPAGLEKIAALTRDVLALPGVVATDVASLASPNMRDLRLTDGGLEPTYLMDEAPQSDGAIGALRRRVDGDPNYRGNLTSLDGAAALVVANFLPDVPDAAIASAALATRARHEDEGAMVFVTGAPVVVPMVEDAASRALLPFALAALLGVAVLAYAAGARAAAGAVIAGGIALLWTLAVLVLWGAVLLPWSAYGLATAALLGALAAVAALPRHARRLAAVAAPPAAAGLILAFAVAPPAAALGVALAVAAACAIPAGVLTRRALGAARERADDAPRSDDGSGLLRIACLTVIALAWLGTLGLRGAFGIPGYGERFLPAQARGGLDAMRRHFPPPSTFVVRLRGAPGFVSDPVVLAAMDEAVRALRSEPGVRSAQSLADIVKLVHRSFNDDDPEFFALPADRGLVSRYLTLAFSPGFRRFVDRGLSRTALWVYADGDDPATLERVHARLQVALAQHPLADVEVDAIAGDGALALGMARTGWQIACGMALAAAGLAIVAALLAALFAGGGALRVALDVVVGGLAALLVGAGLAGWLGLALDLVLVPILACVVVVGGSLALLAGDRTALRPLAAFAAALAVAALPLGLAPGAGRALVPLLVAPLAVLAGLTAAGKPGAGFRRRRRLAPAVSR